MQRTQLGRTGIEVSKICLGTMTWGEQNTEQEAFEQMDYAVAQGVDFFDTAEIYPIMPRPETQGRTETYIGNWMKARGCRDSIVLATKVAGYSDNTHLRGEVSRLSAKHIRHALEGSLKRLQTDYVDLYQLHWPDRQVRLFGDMRGYRVPKRDSVPVEETLRTLDDLVKEGKIRSIGVCNETPWGVASFVRLAELHGLARLVTIQNAYSLINRTFEDGLAEFAIGDDVGLLAYSPLAGGHLTGKYLQGARPEGAREVVFDRGSRYKGSAAENAVAAYVELAKENDMSPVELALAFVRTRPFVTSPIIGATKMSQLKAAIASATVDVSRELEKAIEGIHLQWRNPAP